MFFFFLCFVFFFFFAGNIPAVKMSLSVFLSVYYNPSSPFYSPCSLSLSISSLFLSVPISLSLLSNSFQISSIDPPMEDQPIPQRTQQSSSRPSPSPSSSSNSSSSHLNLPPSMSRAPHSLETLTPSRQIDRMININHHLSPSRAIYSDRFIPSRSGSNFAFFDISPVSNSHSDAREDTSSAYVTLLRTALFGPDAGVVPPATPEKRTSPMSLPNHNIFRYKTETRRSMHSLSPFGFDNAAPGINPSPVKTPRKVPRSPYKVIFVFL